MGAGADPRLQEWILNAKWVNRLVRSHPSRAAGECHYRRAINVEVARSRSFQLKISRTQPFARLGLDRF